VPTVRDAQAIPVLQTLAFNWQKHMKGKPMQRANKTKIQSCKMPRAMKRMLIILAVVLAIGGIFLIAVLSMSVKMEEELAGLQNYEVDISVLEDGIYQGRAETTFVKVEVEVEVKNHKITRIDILKHDNGMGVKAERIVEDMINLNSYEVDAISGATSSSQVIKSAVNDALANGAK